MDESYLLRDWHGILQLLIIINVITFNNRFGGSHQKFTICNNNRSGMSSAINTHVERAHFQ